MFNLKNKSHVQVAKKKIDIIHICFKTFDINLFFLKKKKICRRIKFILEKKKDYVGIAKNMHNSYFRIGI